MAAARGPIRRWSAPPNPAVIPSTTSVTVKVRFVATLLALNCSCSGVRNTLQP